MSSQNLLEGNLMPSQPHLFICPLCKPLFLSLALGMGSLVQGWLLLQIPHGKAFNLLNNLFQLWDVEAGL